VETYDDGDEDLAALLRALNELSRGPGDGDEAAGSGISNDPNVIKSARVTLELIASRKYRA